MKRDWKKWWKAAAIRAAKTFAQTAVSMFTIGQAFSEINWRAVASVAGVAAVFSLLTSLAGLPEEEIPEQEACDE
jgi:hypothetical protein